MADLPFNNSSSLAERRKVIEEDRKASTYFAHAQADADLQLGGRFKAVHTTTFTGADPAVAVPRQPGTSPSNQFALMPEEPPLGFSVEAQDPVGEKFEVEALIAATPPSPSAELTAQAQGGDVRRTGFRRRV
jgi:hypothetical protein